MSGKTIALLISAGFLLLFISLAFSLGMIRLPTSPPCADCQGNKTKDGRAFFDTSHLNGKAAHAADT